MQDENKIKTVFLDAEAALSSEVNETYSRLRLVTDRVIYDAGYDDACRTFQVGKYAAQ